jgi:CTD kinase subunit beta
MGYRSRDRSRARTRTRYDMRDRQDRYHSDIRKYRTYEYDDSMYNDRGYEGKLGCYSGRTLHREQANPNDIPITSDRLVYHTDDSNSGLRKRLLALGATYGHRDRSPVICVEPPWISPRRQYTTPELATVKSLCSQPPKPQIPRKGKASFSLKTDEHSNVRRINEEEKNEMKMVPAKRPVGPHPGLVIVCKDFVFQDEIDACLKAIGMDGPRDTTARLNGVAWLDKVRRALNMPVRTLTKACEYFHRFRLIHPDSEYTLIEACAAALLVAGKIEDTIKKSKEILCAAANLQAPQGEQYTADDPIFEPQSRAVLHFEKEMLEANAFNFKSRWPTQFIVGFGKRHDISKDVLLKAHQIAIDHLRTWAPLKLTMRSRAFACLELAAKLLGMDIPEIYDGSAYESAYVKRVEVYEAIIDLLELYNDHQNQTIVGQVHSFDQFLQIRIDYNNEQKRNTELQRHVIYDTNYDLKKAKFQHNPKALLIHEAFENQAANGHSADSTPLSGSKAHKDTTVRYLFNEEQAIKEKKIVDSYYEDETEQFEIEVHMDDMTPAERVKYMTPQELATYNFDEKGNDLRTPEDDVDNA